MASIDRAAATRLTLASDDALVLEGVTRTFGALRAIDSVTLTVAAGDNVIRVLPPLNIEEEHIREFGDTLSAAAAEYEVPAEAA